MLAKTWLDILIPRIRPLFTTWQQASFWRWCCVTSSSWSKSKTQAHLHTCAHTHTHTHTHARMHTQACRRSLIWGRLLLAAHQARRRGWLRNAGMCWLMKGTSTDLWSGLCDPQHQGLSTTSWAFFLVPRAWNFPRSPALPPAPGAEACVKAQIPVAFVAVTGLVQGTAGRSTGVRGLLSLPACCSSVFASTYFIKNDFCCLQTHSQQLSAFSFHPAHLESSHLRKFLWLISIDIWNWVKWSQERK